MFDLFGGSICERARELFQELDSLSVDNRLSVINAIRLELHKYSPLASEPVDCVLWVKSEQVAANDYNPNSVAPPEMRLLEHSVNEDGYTQPIVTWRNGEINEVVDGYHRNRVGRECPKIRERLHGYLPITIINSNRTDRSDRIASTIRHNRARGKHRVEAMSDIVVELKRRNWTDERICRELGMDQDEVLRLCQITGLSELFTNQEFSKAWDVSGQIDEADFAELTDDVNSYGDETNGFRTVNTSDPDRVFHPYSKWECHKAGFYATSVPGLSRQQCEEAMRDFLANLPAFGKALRAVTQEWKHSCEHYLTNKAMNRIAWLGQAACCYARGIPAIYRSGFYLLTEKQQEAADALALKFLNSWLVERNRKPVSLNEAAPDRQSEIY